MSISTPAPGPIAITQSLEHLAHEASRVRWTDTDARTARTAVRRLLDAIDEAVVTEPRPFIPDHPGHHPESWFTGE